MKALIFDLDGTLLNTIGDLHHCTNYALKKFGFPERTSEEVNSFVGNGLKMLIQRALPDCCSEEEICTVLSCLKEYYMLHSHERTVPYPGIMKLLSDCHQKAIPVAIVSNKADELVKQLNAHFFNDLIEVAIGESPLLPRKPAPDMVFAAMKKLNVTDAIYVGDSDVDIETAKNAGLPCFSVCWGFRTKEQLCAAGATNLIDEPYQLLQKANID